MSKTPNRRRFFIVRAAAKKAENTIVVAGRRIAITMDNSKFAERIRVRESERAYEQAVARHIGYAR